MADAAAHEQRDDAFRARSEMRFASHERIRHAGCTRARILGGEQTVLIEQASQSQAADTAAALKQKLAPRPEPFHASPHVQKLVQVEQNMREVRELMPSQELERELAFFGIRRPANGD